MKENNLQTFIDLYCPDYESYYVTKEDIKNSTRFAFWNLNKVIFDSVERSVVLKVLDHIYMGLMSILVRK